MSLDNIIILDDIFLNKFTLDHIRDDHGHRLVVFRLSTCQPTRSQEVAY